MTLSYDIGRPPLLGHLITLCTISNYIRHDGITEATLVLIHQNGLAAMMSQVVFQITTEVRWREVNFNALLRIMLLNELQGWYKIAVGTNQQTVSVALSTQSAIIRTEIFTSVFFSSGREIA